MIYKGIIGENSIVYFKEFRVAWFPVHKFCVFCSSLPAESFTKKLLHSLMIVIAVCPVRITKKLKQLKYITPESILAKEGCWRRQIPFGFLTQTRRQTKLKIGSCFYCDLKPGKPVNLRTKKNYSDGIIIL